MHVGECGGGDSEITAIVYICWLILGTKVAAFVGVNRSFAVNCLFLFLLFFVLPKSFVCVSLLLRGGGGMNGNL